MIYHFVFVIHEERETGVEYFREYPLPPWNHVSRNIYTNVIVEKVIKLSG